MLLSWKAHFGCTLLLTQSAIPFFRMQQSVIVVKNPMAPILTQTSMAWYVCVCVGVCCVGVSLCVSVSPRVCVCVALCVCVCASLFVSLSLSLTLCVSPSVCVCGMEMSVFCHSFPPKSHKMPLSGIPLLERIPLFLLAMDFLRLSGHGIRGD